MNQPLRRVVFFLVVVLFFGLGTTFSPAADTASLEQRITRLEQLSAGNPPPIINSGDNAWVLASSALVLMMTAPGLILFYGGLVRSKTCSPQ